MAKVRDKEQGSGSRHGAEESVYAREVELVGLAQPRRPRNLIEAVAYFANSGSNLAICALCL